MVTFTILVLKCQKIQYTHMNIYPAKGDRYEYELMVLIDLVKKGREIRECQIATVYHKEKKASSFRPIYDSVQVYKMMWKGKRR